MQIERMGDAHIKGIDGDQLGERVARMVVVLAVAVASCMGMQALASVGKDSVRPRSVGTNPVTSTSMTYGGDPGIAINLPV